MLGAGFVPSLPLGEKDPKYDQYQRSYNPTPKACYLSASQARPMLTKGVVRGGLTSLTHDDDTKQLHAGNSDANIRVKGYLQTHSVPAFGSLSTSY